MEGKKKEKHACIPTITIIFLVSVGILMLNYDQKNNVNSSKTALGVSEPGTKNLPLQEGFEWGLIGTVNTAPNIWQPINNYGSVFTGWEAQEYCSSGGVLLVNNFVNTTSVAGSERFHMENRDDSSSGKHYAYTRTRINTLEQPINLSFQLDIQGKRYDGVGVDESYAAIQFTEDTNNDGIFEQNNYGADFMLSYILDYDGYSDSIGTIDHTVYGKDAYCWSSISTDWDGSTWYHFSRNITTDWLQYLGFSLNKTVLQVILYNCQRVDTSSTAYYLWTNWDNLLISNTMNNTSTNSTRYVKSLPYSEDFEWGSIGHVNNESNTWQPVNTAGSVYTGWEAQEYSLSGGLLLANNFVNTTTAGGGSTKFHMENRDDSSGGKHYAFVRTLINATGFLNNLSFQLDLQGMRYDGAGVDESYPAIQFTEDTNNDGIFETNNYGSDFMLSYIFDHDGQTDSIGTIDHNVYGKDAYCWVSTSTDWDGSTWFHLSRNVTADWLHYLGFSLNKTVIQVVLFNCQCVDTSSTTFYMWSNWDNLTIGSAFPVLDSEPPSINSYISPGLDIQQGDIANITWILNDTNPANYTLLLNDQIISTGTFGHGTVIVRQIDTSVIQAMNYSIKAQDIIGNVQKHDRIINIVERNDNGVFLHININWVDHFNNTNGVIFNFSMRYWTVFYFTYQSGSMSGLPSLPAGLVIALPLALNMRFVNASALISGIIRVYYDQPAIASQVNENDFVVLRMNPVSQNWEDIGATLHKENNYLEFDVSVGGMYIIASTPKANYVPIITILVIGLIFGIVSIVAYNSIKKKSVKLQGKSKSMKNYTEDTSRDTIHTINEAQKKHERLLRVSQSEASPIPLKKGKGSTEPDVDIALRISNAQQIASEVKVEPVTPKCIVHKGPISGFSYTCKSCGVPYCLECMKHLIDSGEGCWNCGEHLDNTFQGVLSPTENTSKTVLTVFSLQVTQKLKELNLPEEIYEEVIERLKFIPPEQRIQYLEQTFPDKMEFDKTL